MKLPTINKIISDFYEGALDHARWQEGLQGFAALAKAQGANFLIGSQSAATANVMTNVGMNPEAISAYNRHYHLSDPFAPLSLGLPVATWMNDWREFGPRGYKTSEYYNDFMRAHKVHAVLSMTLMRSSDSIALISVQRNTGQKEFDANDERRLAPLIPHIQRAVRLQAHTSELRREAGMARLAVDYAAGPLWVVDHQGKILLANRRAEERLSTSRCLYVRFGFLQAHAGSQTKFAAALRQATTPPMIRATWLLLEAEQSTGVPVVIAPLPVGAPMNGDFQKPLAVVILAQSGPESGATLPALRDLYRLTPTECQVADLVTGGLTVLEIATNLSAAPGTIRVHLRSVFQKTGVHRQAELCRLVQALRHAVPPRAVT